jgi:YggT family protein
VTIGNLILDLLQLYSLLIIIRAVMSWMRVDPRNQFVRILNALTDPVLDPIQRVIPPIGGNLDISPVVAILLVQLLREVIARIFL